MKEFLIKLVNGQNLTEEETKQAMEIIMSGNATPSQISAFLTALKMKGETIDEITGCAKIMKEKALTIEKPKELLNQPIIDTCGTGGTGVDTFNISTAVAILTAACGIKVAKHGNRAASSKCGSADVLEGLGVKIDLQPHQAMECLKEIGICFLFAPLYHTAMKHVMPTRREIGFRTIFNILGPLTNPFSPTGQLLGVFSENLTEIMAQVLDKMGVKKAFVVYGYDKTDEISITTKTKITELDYGKIKTYYVEPQDFGFKKANLSDIEGKDVKGNCEIITSIFKGEKGPKRDVTVLNAAFAILTSGLLSNVNDAIKLAQETIDTSKALKKLNNFIEFSSKYKA